MPYLAHVLQKLVLKKWAIGSAQPSISYSQIKDIQIALPAFEQQLELNEWFDKIELQNETLVKLLKKQSEKFDELTNLSIASNCVQQNN